MPNVTKVEWDSTDALRKAISEIGAERIAGSTANR